MTYINKKEYDFRYAPSMPSDDTLDCFDAVQAFITERGPRTYVFGAGRAYNFLDRNNGALLFPLGSRIIKEEATESLNFSGYGSTGTATAYIKAENTFTSFSVFSDIPARSMSISLTEVPTGVSVGDLFVIHSDEELNERDSTLNNLGEWQRVAAVSGTTIYTVSEISLDYTVSGNNLTVSFPDEKRGLVTEGLDFVGSGVNTTTSSSLGDRGIEVYGATYWRDYGSGGLDSDAYSLFAKTCNNVLFDQSFSAKTDNLDGSVERTRYGLAVAGAVDKITMRDVVTEGGTEGISPTSSGGIGGLKREIKIFNPTCKGCQRSGVATHHGYLHMSVQDGDFVDCNQGIDARLGGYLEGNRFVNTGAGLGNLNAAVRLGEGYKDLTSRNNTMINVLRGYWLPDIEHFEVPTGDINIKGDVMREVGSAGVLLEYAGTTGGNDLNAELGSLTVHADIELSSTGSPRGILSYGKYTDVDIDLTVRGGSSAARPVFMTRASDSSSSTGGPKNVIVKTKRPSDLLPTDIQFEEGTTYQEERDFGG